MGVILFNPRIKDGHFDITPGETLLHQKNRFAEVLEK
jgi:hypothetical protein